VRRLLVVGVLVLSVAGEATGRNEIWSRRVASGAHLSFELPPGWTVTELRTGAVTATSFAAPRRWRRLPSSGAVVYVYPPGRGRFATLHRRLRLPDGVADSFLQLSGTAFRFNRGGRDLQVAVAFRGRRKEAMMVVNGVWPWPPRVRVKWRRSRSVGLPDWGRLVGGVQLPEQGLHFFTWDPILRTQPDRPGRRWGHARLVRLVLRIVRAYARAHPSAPRLGIGDLSRPRGGWFGPRHASHQNGLDVDIFFPRIDRRERPPDHPDQIDRGLAQDLVDRFVRGGATRVFVGPRTRLHGPRNVVQVLAGHDNHLHVRIAK
jgi:Penicillin-insensitive murein endopeptidase